MSDETTGATETTSAEPAKGWRYNLAELKGENADAANTEGEVEAASETQGKAEPEAAQEVAPPEDSYAKRFTALAYKTKELARKQAAFKAERAKHAEESKALSVLREQIKSDPLAAMHTIAEQAGIQFQDLFSRATRSLAQLDPTPEEIAQREAQRAVDEYRKKVEAETATQESARLSAARESATQEALMGFEETLLRGDYPILGTKNPKLVAKAALDIAQREYNATKKVLDFSACLDRIESELQSEHERAAQAVAARKNRVGRPAENQSDEDSHGQSVQSAPGAVRARTLTQRHSGESGPPKTKGWRERLEGFKSGAD